MKSNGLSRDVNLSAAFEVKWIIIRPTSDELALGLSCRFARRTTYLSCAFQLPGRSRVGKQNGEPEKYHKLTEKMRQKIRAR